MYTASWQTTNRSEAPAQRMEYKRSVIANGIQCNVSHLCYCNYTVTIYYTCGMHACSYHRVVNIKTTLPNINLLSTSAHVAPSQTTTDRSTAKDAIVPVTVTI
jgi:hypothetical protein